MFVDDKRRSFITTCTQTLKMIPAAQNVNSDRKVAFSSLTTLVLLKVSRCDHFLGDPSRDILCYLFILLFYLHQYQHSITMF